MAADALSGAIRGAYETGNSDGASSDHPAGNSAGDDARDELAYRQGAVGNGVQIASGEGINPALPTIQNDRNFHISPDYRLAGGRLEVQVGDVDPSESHDPYELRARLVGDARNEFSAPIDDPNTDFYPKDAMFRETPRSRVIGQQDRLRLQLERGRALGSEPLSQMSPEMGIYGDGIDQRDISSFGLPSLKMSLELGGGTKMMFSAMGQNLLKGIETLRLNPYDDQTGKDIAKWVPGATIGYGRLIAKNEWNLYKDGISADQAETIFIDKLKPFVNSVESSLTVHVSQNKFDALVLFNYNIGISAFEKSSALKMINDPTAKTKFESVEEAWKSFNKSQGKVMNGLNNRRSAEWDMYSNGIYRRW
ncbi:MAG: lysozyme [Rhodocyclales bacterium]|nr:lysozyme [Rhodocyclales bacterium]